MHTNLPTLQSLAKPDEIRRIIGIYEQTREDFSTIQRCADRMKTNLSTIEVTGLRVGCRTMLSDIVTGPYNSITKDLRERTWRALIQRTGILDRLSSDRRDKMEREITSTLELEISYDNIVVILSQIGENWKAIHEELVLEAFDHLTRNARNRVGRRGKYVTNDAYAVGPKVIMTRPGTFSCGADRLHDVDKALCFLLGKSYSYQGSTVDCIEKTSRKSTEGQSQFFTFKIYSETVHLKWIEEEDRVKFNRLVASLRPAALPGEIKERE